MSNEPEILKSLLGAEALDEFVAGYWPDRIFVAHGDMGRLPEAILDPELNDFDTLSRRYKGVVSFFGDARSNHMVPVEGIEAADPYYCGLSVYLTDVGPYFPEVERMVRRLEHELGVNEGCARAGVFASPTSAGISCHYDCVDVFSIQLKGTKKFDVAPVEELPYPLGFQYIHGSRPIDDLYPQATLGFPRSEDLEFETVEMKPGTVMYMPRGTWHRTEAGGDSISVSIGMDPPSAAQTVLEQLRLLLLQDPAWRKPLYGAWGAGAMSDAAVEHARDLIARLPGAVACLDPRLLASLKKSDPQRIAEMSAESLVQRIPNSTLSVGEPPGNSTEEDSLLASIEVNDRSAKKFVSEIEMPARCAPVLSWIDSQRGSFRVAEAVEKFPELTLDQHLQVIQCLTSAGLLKVYWFPKLQESRSPG